MKKIDLTQEHSSIEELLQFATLDSVLIRNQKGVEFLLEPADAFDREIAELSRSERFLSFLDERSKKPGRISLEEIDRCLSLAEQAAQDRS